MKRTTASCRTIGKEFVSDIKNVVMWLTEILMKNANEICFSAAMVISLLFYYQYKKYEEEVEKEEMIEGFLS